MLTAHPLHLPVRRAAAGLTRPLPQPIISALPAACPAGQRPPGHWHAITSRLRSPTQQARPWGALGSIRYHAERPPGHVAISPSTRPGAVRTPTGRTQEARPYRNEALLPTPQHPDPSSTSFPTGLHQTSVFFFTSCLLEKQASFEAPLHPRTRGHTRQAWKAGSEGSVCQPPCPLPRPSSGPLVWLPEA